MTHADRGFPTLRGKSEQNLDLQLIIDPQSPRLVAGFFRYVRDTENAMVHEKPETENVCRRCGTSPRRWEHLNDGLCPSCYWSEIKE